MITAKTVNEMVWFVNAVPAAKKFYNEKNARIFYQMQLVKDYRRIYSPNSTSPGLDPTRGAVRLTGISPEPLTEMFYYKGSNHISQDIFIPSKLSESSDKSLVTVTMTDDTEEDNQKADMKYLLSIGVPFSAAMEDQRFRPDRNYHVKSLKDFCDLTPLQRADLWNDPAQVTYMKMNVDTTPLNLDKTKIGKEDRPEIDVWIDYCNLHYPR